VARVRFARLPLESRPTPPAARTDDRLAALAGLAAWAVALVVVLARRGSLVADDRGWWVWACVAGLVLGVVGLVHLQRREIKHRTAARRQRRAAAVPVPARAVTPILTSAQAAEAAARPATPPTTQMPVVAPPHGAGAPEQDGPR
jgi:hypothetical protein